MTVGVKNYSGDDLLSQERELQVPSALEGLTAVFGMGTGVPPPVSPPETLCYWVLLLGQPWAVGLGP